MSGDIPTVTLAAVSGCYTVSCVGVVSVWPQLVSDLVAYGYAKQVPGWLRVERSPDFCEVSFTVAYTLRRDVEAALRAMIGTAIATDTTVRFFCCRIT